MRRFISVVIFIAFTVATASAQGISGSIEEIIHRANDISGEQLGPGVQEITNGNCAVQSIIGDAFFGKFSNAIDNAIKSYESGGSALLQKADSPAFARRVNMQGWRYSDLGLSSVKTRGDLVRILAQLTLSMAADLKAAKEGHDADALERVLANSAKSTRLILAIIDIP